MFKTCLFLFLITFHLCFTYKLLLVFPLPRKSHSILGAAFVRHLLQAGHQVTYITPEPPKDQLPNLRVIDVSTIKLLYPVEKFLNLQKLTQPKCRLNDHSHFIKYMFDFANTTIFHENVQHLLQDPEEQFDVVIAEWMYNELYSGFSSVFNCPYIWFSSTDAFSSFLTLIEGTPNPALITNFFSSKDPPFSFWQRVEELFKLIKTKIHMWYYFDMQNDAFHKAFDEAARKRGRSLPTFSAARLGAALALGNSHSATGGALRLPQAYKQIGGFHLDDEVKPLPEYLGKILDNAQYGFIYFSLGTIVRSMDMTADMKKELLEVFSTLKQTVIWKFEDDSLDRIPNNVHIIKWAPQQSILAHRNCVLLITHGGLLSIIEAVNFGVPIIGIPIFADQFINMIRAVAKGFARRVNFGSDLPKNVKTEIKEILTHKQYKEKAKEYSAIFHHRLAPPGEELVHWVEHVVETQGVPHLRSPSLDVPFYQKIYLDLIAVILLAIYILKIMFIRLIAYCSRKIIGLKNKKN